VGNDSDFVVCSSHFGDSPGVSVDVVGTKGWGLLQLPLNWTPPFVVLTQALHTEWIGLGEAAARELLTGIVMNSPAIAAFTSGDSELLVRSSAVDEALTDRGQFESYRTSPGALDLVDTIETSWKTHSDSSDGLVSALPLVIQPHVSCVLAGHMSNERRVSRRHDSWLIEILNRDGALIDSERVQPDSPDRLTLDPIRVRSMRDIPKALRSVPTQRPRSPGNQPGRRHYEWVWDGSRVWIVQCDFEITIVGEAPNSKWTRTTSSAMPTCSSLIDSSATNGAWHKTRCVDTFQSCGFPTARLLVLQDPEILGQLERGIVGEAVAADVESLAQLPLVVRTDIADSVNRSTVLLPRTETCTSAEDVFKFLLATTRQFHHEGLKANEYCFLLHRFIPARSGAYSMGAPGKRMVRVDGIWGLPDGLLFSPCDSFEVDVVTSTVTWRKPRCKETYLDFDDAGTWFTARSGSTWDWAPSLQDDEVVAIALQTFAVAEREQSQVEVMHFVGVHEYTLLPPVLPWYFRNAADYENPVPSKNVARLPLPYVTIRMPDDLERATQKLGGRGSETKQSIRLMPFPEFVRDNEFLDAVADLALELGLPIRLEGSILAHAYYMLTKRGVRVFMMDLEGPPAGQGLQVFEKLVRDDIPGAIEKGGERALVRRATAAELLPLLKRKALEESLELMEARELSDTIEEAADVFEVLRAIMHVLAVPVDELIRRADEKRETRGGFDEGKVLEATYLRSLLSELESDNQLFPVIDEPTEEIRRRSRVGEDWIAIKPGDRETIQVTVSRLPNLDREPSSLSTVDLRAIGIHGRMDVWRNGTEINIQVSGGQVDVHSEDQLSFW
jgi:predicted house-cleaning noncanonical NTP pyrophosphatase (MazG superfamily)